MMQPKIPIMPGLPPTRHVDEDLNATPFAAQTRLRLATVVVSVALVFLLIAGKLVLLGLRAGESSKQAMAAPISEHFARPDIIDRKGRLLATDILMPSLFADPAMIVDLDEAVEKLLSVFPDMDGRILRHKLGNKHRRFVWLRRGLSPAVAQKVHDLGVPGLAFRRELRRVYPAGPLAGHVLGSVDVDNRGLAGIERYIDETFGVERTHKKGNRMQAPVVLSLDMGVQHALTSELEAALRRYRARAASGIVLDVASGEIMAAVSLPQVDPSSPASRLKDGYQNRLMGGTYELGSIFKTMTVAMALDSGQATLRRVYDVSRPVKVGRRVISDSHGSGRPLNVRDIFLRSSNVGAALIAREAGTTRQQAFLQELGLLEQMKTEAGAVARPALPQNWNDDATTTIAYGHGLAVAPLQFAVAAAALINGGTKIKPTFLPTIPQDGDARKGRVLSKHTSRVVRRLMRLNVTAAYGTGRRAEVKGYLVGGKTGTAEIPGVNGYAKKKVISSFLAAFPMDAPKYLILISLFEPQGTPATGGQIVASVNAAPTTARLIRRIAPLLGVKPAAGR